jgi:DNA polymerase III subunit epsilon
MGTLTSRELGFDLSNFAVNPETQDRRPDMETNVMKRFGISLACTLLLAALPALGQNLAQVTFTAVDQETTGLNAASDRVIEIGAVKFRNGKIIESRSWLIDPGIPIPEESIRIHHIAPDMVAGRPSFKSVYPEFKDFVRDTVVLCHNAPFDVGFLRAETERSGLPRLDNQVLDTLRLARSWFPNAPGHSLEALAAHLGIELKSAHRALADASALVAVFMAGTTNLPASATLADLAAGSGNRAPPAQPAVRQPAPGPPVEAAPVPLEVKLRTIVVPEIAFQDAAVPDVLRFLLDSSRTLDRDPIEARRGVNMVQCLSPQERAKTVTFSAKGLTLKEALTAICDLAKIPFRVETSYVMIGSARAAQRNEGRTYSVPFVLVSDIKKQGARKFFESMGVQFPEGATANYNAASGKLIVVNTPDNLKTLEKILAELGVPVPRTE